MQRMALRAAVSGLVVGAVFAASCGAAERQDWENTYDGDGEDLFLVDDDFTCLAQKPWESVDNFKVWNPLGHQETAVDHARAHRLGEYPVGTGIALFHNEVSVKRGPGFSPETQDWEFLTLDVDADRRTMITNRGTTDVGNIAGSCISCHAGAQAFDMVCGTNNSCGALPFFIDTHPDSKVEDPRCVD